MVCLPQLAGNSRRAQSVLATPVSRAENLEADAAQPTAISPLRP